MSSALRVLERAYDAPGALPEHEWRFFYFEVYSGGRCVLRTFFTSALCKEDMLAPAPVSRLAEEKRADDPDFLVSRLFLMGTLLGECRQMWWDEDAAWRDALDLVLDAAAQEAEREGAATLVLGQFAREAESLAEPLIAAGFHPSPFPRAYDLRGFSVPETWLAGLSPKSRRHVRTEVLPYTEQFVAEASPASGASAAELRCAYELHLRLKARSFEVNDFPLPASLWREAAAPGTGFDLLRLRRPGGELLAAGLGFAESGAYTPVVLGLAAGPQRIPGLYRRALLQAIERARELHCEVVRFGPGADLEKRRMGATPVPLRLFVRFLQPERLKALAELVAETEARRAPSLDSADALA